MSLPEFKIKDQTLFITADTRFPQFLPYPVFLLERKISMTAKAVYALLLNRSRLSQMNRWEDDHGRVFIVYPIEELVRDMHRSRSSIKSALRELESEELIFKRRTEFGRANHLYVKLPRESENAPYEDRKQSPSGLGNAPPNRQVSDLQRGDYPPPNHNTESTYISNQNAEMTRSSFGRYKNIWLSDAEHAALLSDFPVDLDRYLEEVSCYLAAAGRTYRNYEAGIRSWALKDTKNKKTSKTEKYSHTEEDTL